MSKRFPSSTLRPAGKKLRLEDELEIIAKRLKPVPKIVTIIDNNYDIRAFQIKDIKFRDLMIDLIKIFLQYAWTERDHLNIILVCKLFRNIIYDRNFFPFHRLTYFPSPIIFKKWHGNFSQLPIEIFKNTCNIFDKNTINITNLINKPSSNYKDNSRNIVRLLSLPAVRQSLEFKLNFHQFLDDNVEFIGNNLNWVLVCSHYFYWYFQLDWNINFAPCPDKLYPLARETFLQWLTERYRNGFWIFSQSHLGIFRMMMLNWNETTRIIGDKLFPIDDIKINNEELYQFIERLAKSSSPTNLFKKINN